ncbi:hypothetical protein Pla163_11170 [Planctomycetes bacterium Pla163]|uniref:Toprim domain-containing protein n=1 Tax=Rohdeia mirabilis TaxID=2528008 RepID=A0A518CXT7_9BACT|nr:hypothetical protein Pla163_11170 [Planctomycetes bacterium Pla163]
MSPLEHVLVALERAGSRGRQVRNGWQYQCPAHDDARPSLHIRESDNGSVLLHDFAGCSTEAVVAALGLTMGSLFRDSGRTRSTRHLPITRAPRPAEEPSHGFESFDSAAAAYRHHFGPEHARWDYHDQHRQLVGSVLRWNRPGGKEVRPVSLLADGCWHRKAMPAPRPLYRLPDLWEGDEPFVVVEGEKCADAAVDYGLNATTSAGGSSAAVQTDWSPLAGQPVVIIPDRDAAGQRYADAVASILLRLDPRADVRLVELTDVPEGGDIADLLAMWRDEQ